MSEAAVMSDAEFEQWVTDAQLPALRGEQLSQKVASYLPGGGLALISADIDRIKDFVFESNKLPEIRGASMMLEQLLDPKEDAGIKHVFEAAGLRATFVDDPEKPGCLIYAGGGSLLALVPRAVAARIRAELEALFPRQTGMATITCVVLDIDPQEITDGYRFTGTEAFDALPRSFQRRIAVYFRRDHVRAIDKAALEKRKHFGELVRLQALRLRQAKDEKATLPFFETEPLVRRCDSCRRRPAAVFERHPDPRYYCRVCHQKAGAAESSRGPSERRLRRSYWHGELWNQPDSAPEHLEAIGEAAQGGAQGYVGFIYADGNNVGHTLEGCRTPIDFRKRSQGLTEAVRGAVKQSLQDMIESVEVLAIGGDDTLLIVPGDVALEVSRRICQMFQETLEQAGFRRDGAGAPTMSAGVVMADSHNPVSFMRDLAEQLLKNAKRRARETGTGTVDFLVLKSQSTLATSLDHLRESWPLAQTDTAAMERLLLTRRPYTLDELARLLALAREARDTVKFPRTQLYALQDALIHEGRLASSIYFLYQLARQRDDQRRRFLQSLLWDGVNLDDPEGVARAFPLASPPWRQRESKEADKLAEYDTIVVDLIDILDFCGGGSDGPYG